MTTTELKEKIAKFEKLLAKTTDAKEKEVIEKGLDKLKLQLKQSEESEKTPEPKKAEPKTPTKPVKKVDAKKEEKKAKTKKAIKKAKEDDFDCEEAERLMKERRKKAKENANKKTQPILKIIADKFESGIKSAIHYNKAKGGEQNIAVMKKAVTEIAKGLDTLKDALKGDFEDTFIDRFKEDLMKVIKVLEKKESK